MNARKLQFEEEIGDQITEPSTSKSIPGVF